MSDIYHEAYRQTGNQVRRILSDIEQRQGHDAAMMVLGLLHLDAIKRVTPYPVAANTRYGNATWPIDDVNKARCDWFFEHVQQLTDHEWNLQCRAYGFAMNTDWA